ncbi:metal-dependent hydrolase [Maritalea sp.]|jgi:hypothetical protein|uniref:metal-dependent hydrolase n=1 Tax=Maritalea sp. TaxID=2003361 RepID=UPI0039E5779E
MLTNTHVLIAAAALTRRRYTRRQNLLIVFGGFFPDLSLFVMFVVGRMPGSQITNLWRKPDGMYWQEPWQFLSALSNSFPIYIAALLIFLLLLRSAPKSRVVWLSLVLFVLAGLTHILVDFMTHADDAHVQFWPFSGARFNSPISYWQSQYYGKWVGAFELLMGAGLVTILWRRFASWQPRVGVALLGLPYLASVAFTLAGFGHQI